MASRGKGARPAPTCIELKAARIGRRGPAQSARERRTSRLAGGGIGWKGTFFKKPQLRTHWRARLWALD